MLRFNLIIHGLVGLIKPHGRLGFDIYIPYPHNKRVQHYAKWGIPLVDQDYKKPVRDKIPGLRDIPHENFILDMHFRPHVGDLCDFDANEFVVLKGLIPQARKIWAKIAIPPPTVIRKYRAIESYPAPHPDLATVSALGVQPRLVHQIIVFSYVDVKGPIALIGDSSSEVWDLSKLPQSPYGDAAINFSVYYQPVTTTHMAHDAAPYNNMFNVIYNGKKAPLKIETLSTQYPSSGTYVDGSPSVFARNTGLATKDLASLSELANPISYQLNPRVNIPQMNAVLLFLGQNIAVFAEADPTSCGPSSGNEDTGN